MAGAERHSATVEREAKGSEVALAAAKRGQRGAMANDPSKSERVSSTTDLTEGNARFSEAVRKVTPLPGHHDVFIHGEPNGFSVAPRSELLNARQVAGMIRERGSYQGGPVRLCSCRAGAPGGTAAQALSDELGAQVLAPTHTLWLYPNGKLVVGPDAETPIGRWQRFFPRDRQP